jgi:hypothetical protein
MRPHILSPKLQNNFDFRDIQQELTVGFILLLSSLPVDVVWNSHLKKYVNSKHLYKNFIIVDAAYFFHKTLATFFRDTHVL